VPSPSFQPSQPFRISPSDRVFFPTTWTRGFLRPFRGWTMADVFLRCGFSPLCPLIFFPASRSPAPSPVFPGRCTMRLFFRSFLGQESSEGFSPPPSSVSCCSPPSVGFRGLRSAESHRSGSLINVFVARCQGFAPIFFFWFAFFTSFWSYLSGPFCAVQLLGKTLLLWGR